MTIISTLSPDTLAPGDYHYVTGSTGKLIDVHLVVESPTLINNGYEYAWTLPHQRPAGAGWGNMPETTLYDYSNRVLWTLWVRDVTY